MAASIAVLRAALSPRGEPEGEVARAVALGEGARSRDRRIVLDHDHLRAAGAGLGRDGGQRHREVLAAAAGRERIEAERVTPGGEVRLRRR